MNDPKDPRSFNEGPDYVIAETLLRAIIRLAKRSEYTLWNGSWNQMSCEWCGAPRTSNTHADFCRWKYTFEQLERLHKKLLEPPVVDAMDDVEALDLQALFFHELESDILKTKREMIKKRRKKAGSERPFWED